MEIAKSHYDSSYFAWQCSRGELSASLDRWKFEPFIGKDDVVLDFGCGGGYMLASLDCKDRYGIEINPAARAEAAKRLKPFASLDELPGDVTFDAIISHHALEHVDDPLGTLSALRSHLKPGGMCVVVVPCDVWWGKEQGRFSKEDINQHLYTWTPLSLGNLLTRAGYSVHESGLLCHRWPPKVSITSKLPAPIVDLLARLWSGMTFSRQVRAVAANETID